MKLIVLLCFAIFGMVYATDLAPWYMGANCAADARCPSIENTSNPVFLASTSCNKFFQCAYGMACELTCPTGLHWSAILNRCEWPSVACCDPTVPCVDANPTVPTTAAPITTPGGTAPNPTQCTVDARCPLNDNTNQPTLLAHETDCGQFYACSYGRRCPLKCKTGEHFSVQLQRCDWPEIACCGSTIQCQQPTIPPVTPTASPSTECRPDARCPLDDDTFKPLLLPVSGNCGAFYKCRNGDACLLPCPTGQHFSQTLQVCEWPQTACCDPSVTCNQSRLLESLSVRK